MAAKRRSADEATELLRTLLIVQLGLAGIGQRDIRVVAGCDMNRVSKTLRALKLKRGKKNT
jgi:hypothetical protein